MTRAGRPPIVPLEIRVEGEMAYVPLTCGGEAVIDAADAEFVSRWAWRSKLYGGAGPYVWRCRQMEDPERPKHIALHRALMEPGPRLVVDHRDGDGLNCRRGNMRVCTQAENRRNSRKLIGGLKGVHRAGTRWRAAICLDGVRVGLGSYGTPEEAHAAYCEAARRLHGEFARTE